jgi:hypothetical protein
VFLRRARAVLAERSLAQVSEIPPRIA